MSLYLNLKYLLKIKYTKRLNFFYYIKTLTNKYASEYKTKNVVIQILKKIKNRINIFFKKNYCFVIYSNCNYVLKNITFRDNGC